MSKILIVDDDRALCRTLEIHLQNKDHDVRSALSAEGGLQIGKTWAPDIVFLDINLPDQSGLKCLDKFLQSGAIVIIVTGEGSNRYAVESLSSGAFDYLRKPFDLNEVLRLIEEAKRQGLAYKTATKKDVNKQERYPEIIGSHPDIIALHKMIGILSQSSVSVLIQGESGTGKELAARILHDATSPLELFVAINCSAIVPTLLESELFGHEKGAFTGADRAKVGQMEYAGKGTLFLDEIGDLPMNLQGKLLRVLQENEFVRVGGLEALPFESRVVAACNQDLPGLVQEGKFRRDLYYRLAVSTIATPPLRRRQNDIPELVYYLLDKICSALGKTVHKIDDEAMRMLMTHDWPGNVRELENVLTSAVALSRGVVIEPKSIHFENIESLNEQRKPVTLAEAEKRHIKSALVTNKWNITRTAMALDISPTTLRKKIVDFELREAV